MAKIPKKIICLVTASVILCAHVPIAHAEAIPNVLEGSATLADNIMSYYALSGSAVANTEWINTLYDSYGSSFGTIYDFAENGMLTLNNDGTWQATTALETAIENAPAYQSLGLDQMFNVSSQEAAAGGGIAASGAATLAGSLGGVASTGVLPLFGGVTAAYWGGIGVGTLIAHLIGLYGDEIENGTPITDKQFLDNAPSGMSAGFEKILSPSLFAYSNGIYSTGKIFAVGYKRSDGDLIGSFYSFSSNSSNGNYRIINLKNGNQVGSGNLTYSDGVSGSFAPFDHSANRVGLVTPLKIVVDSSAVNTYLNALRQGTTTLDIYSPDLIGENGNQKAFRDKNGNITVPDFKPQIDTGVQSGKPLTLQDWLNFANSVTNNNSNTNPLPDNKALFDDLINAIKKVIPNPNPNPDPNPDPDPDPDPYHPPKPTPVPDPDYGDPNPDQPDFESETDIPDPVDTGNPWVTPNLLDKFPFCIPKDMIDMVKGFKSADRTAPHISWNFKSPIGHVDYTFNLDLEDFEDLATLLRTLELAAFIVGLAFSTRYLIGAS